MSSASVMTAVARSLALGSGDGLDVTLQRITALAVETLPWVDYASLSFLRADGHLETTAPTDSLARDLDSRQYELREGPCYEAVSDIGVVRSQHVGTDPRWPRYAPIAADAGINSQLALEVYRNHSSRGGLNLYARQPEAFSYRDNLAELFATHAAVAMGYAYELESVRQALSTRKTIGQALGILMSRYDLSEERAFAALVRISQDSNRKLREVARDVVTARGLHPTG
jgi:ANTAR domain-containing protein/GAF domain-containing protein